MQCPRVLILLLAVSAAGVAQPRANRPPSRPGLPRSRGPFNGPLEPLCLHFGLAKDCSAADLIAPPPSPEAPRQIRVLAASVADPRDSPLALYFDRSIEALMWACDDAGYSLESYWGPWDAEASPDALTKIGRELAVLTKELGHPGNAPTRPEASGQPGILLFRGSDWEHVLVVFLVGETTIGGVDVRAFQAVAEYAQAFSGTNDLWFVGPSFSGTFESLSRLLQQPINSKPISMRVVTGMATSSDAQWKFQKARGVDPVKVQIATVENDKYAFHAFIDYLWSHWKDPGEIALIAEDETAYGRLAEGLQSLIKSHAECRGAAHEQWLFVRFPREIARLRNTYEEQTAAAMKQGKAGADAASGGQTAATGTAGNLEFHLSTPETVGDSVPVFSRQQTPVSEDGVLLNLASSLQRERVRYAGIIATDVLDAIFLARFLRAACPDVRVFIFDADLLFAMAGMSTPLDGILTITTYPLFARNQHWTREERKGQLPRRIPFASRYSEGVYNAARYQLCESGAQKCADPSNPSDQPAPEVMLEYTRPGLNPGNRPPLWLTVLGRDGYWPLALLDAPDAGDAKCASDPTLITSLVPGVPKQPSDKTRSEELHPDLPSHTWSVILALVGLASLLHSLYIFLPYARPHAAGKMGAAVSSALYRVLAVYPRQAADAYPGPLLVVALALGALNIVIGTSGAPYILRRGATMTGQIGGYLIFWIPLVCLGVLLCAAVVLTRIARGSGRFMTVTWLMFGTFCVFWFELMKTYGSADDQAFFFAYRMSQPATLLSPATPLMLLLVIAFAWGFMLVARRAGVEPPDIPAIPEIRGHAAKLNLRLGEVVSGTRAALVLLLLGLWISLFHPWNRLRSIESAAFDYTVTFLLALAYGLLAMTWTQVISAWRSFGRFLESLERHPMREAFSRLPKELGSLPLFRPGPEKSDLFTTSRCLDTAQAFLISQGLKDRTDLEFVQQVGRARECFKQAEMQITEGHKEQPARASEVLAVSHELERKVLEIANGFITALETSWQLGSSESLAGSEPGDKSERAPHAARILAEEFIALRIGMYIRHVLRQMRALFWFVVIGLVLTVLALSSYPFASRRLIDLTSIVMLGLFAVGFAAVFAQLDRDAILSRISQKAPNEIGKGFIVRVAAFGALPLLTVLATQFPSVGRLLFSWVQPALEALR